MLGLMIHSRQTGTT